MNSWYRTASIAAIGLAVMGVAGAVSVSAQDTPSPVYGSQLMTEQERLEHRDRLRDAKSLAERERIRAEHHQRMVKRAEERGINLPDEPTARGQGRAKACGSGMGQGHGMGSGRGRGSGG